MMAHILEMFGHETPTPLSSCLSSNEAGEPLLCVFCDAPGSIRTEGLAPECDACFQAEAGQQGATWPA